MACDERLLAQSMRPGDLVVVGESNQIVLNFIGLSTLLPAFGIRTLPIRMILLYSIEFRRKPMASEPGGRADKLGNEFERLWAVRHLIELLAGRATTFKMEALGNDEKGTEFWVTRPDGTREAHQCKRENESFGKWSVAQLEAKHVISAAKSQLDRSPSHRFVFVSGDKASHLSDLCERSERNDSPAEFVTFLTTTSGGLKTEFTTLCDRLDVNPVAPDGAAKVVDFLRRFRPEVIDKNRLRSEVEGLSERWITGEPREVVAALKDLLDRSIGKTLIERDVIAALPDGARPVDLAKDPTLGAALDSLRDRFDRSYRHLLIGGRSLGRKESAAVVSMLTNDDGPQLVLLHGPGGEGKSGVAFEVVEQLNQRGIPCLPLRLDRDRPENSPLEFGKLLGLPGSPANCLSAAAGDGLGVLVLDQVDAIRWTAAHSSHAWDTCERTISGVLGSPNLRVIVVCRSFDLEDDPRIKAWEKENRATRFKVEPLDDGTVDEVISSRGVSPSSIASQQRKVLRSPQGLFLWLALHEGEHPPPAFRTMTDLMRSFWRTIRRRFSGLKAGKYEAVLEALITHMDRRGVLSAPRTIVEQWREDVDGLLSMNVIIEGPGERLLFSHQSFLDYLTADRIARRVLEDQGTVLGWLAEDDQSLFRRSQLRQLLTLLRDDDPERFLDSMKSLLHGNGVRFHLQHLAVQMLGHSEDPTEDDVGLVVGLLERPEWVNHVFFQVLAGRESWFDALHRRGKLRQWLEGPDEGRVNLATRIVERVVESRGEEVESLFLEKGRERWPGRLVAAVWRTSLDKLTNGLFDTVVDLRRRGEWAAHDFVNWKFLAQEAPTRCLRMLEAKIGRDLDEVETRPADAAINRLERDDSSMLAELLSLTSSAEAMPVEWWDALLPCYLRASKLLGRLRRQSRRTGWNPIIDNSDRVARGIKRVLREVLTAAGSAMARDKPHAFWERAESASHGAKLAQRLINRCSPHGTEERADSAIRRLLRDPSWFGSQRARGGSVYLTAWKVLHRYSAACSDELFAELETSVLTFWPAEEREAYRYYHDRKRGVDYRGQLEFDALEFNDLGLGQFLLLSGMSRSRLSPGARDRLGVFKRKFGAVKPLLKGRPKFGGGWVGTTIPSDRLSKVSDRNWLRIIRRDWSSHSRYPKQMGPDRLGEVSVEMFARDLGRAAALSPARFARLALRMPVDCDPRYPIAILHSLAERNPPTEASNGPPGDQVTIAQIEAVIRRFAFLESDREFAMSVCRAIRQRHDASWADDMILLLSRLAASHPDPEPDIYAVPRLRGPDRGCENEDRPDVAMSSINCVRGAAAGAIEAILFGQPDRLAMLQSAIDTLLNDPHAAVRAAAVGIALPLYKIDRDAAVEVLLKACAHPDDAVLTAYDLVYFFRYAILDFADALRPLLERMLGSKIGKVAKTGAAFAAVAWAHRGVMDDIVGASVDGTCWVRIGVADALSKAVAEGHDRPEVINRLRSLFDDQEKQVRDVAAGAFRIACFFDQPSAVSLAEAFLQSRANDDNVYGLLHGLDELTGPLKPYSSVICGLADRFAGPLAAEARDYRTHRPLDAGLLAKVLLRLYEQSEHDRALRRKCLDAWDALIRQGIGYDVLQHVDA